MNLAREFAPELRRILRTFHPARQAEK
jgi:hypothetical protein